MKLPSHIVIERRFAALKNAIMSRNVADIQFHFDNTLSAVQKTLGTRGREGDAGTVTICGSTRFRAEIAEANRMLTMRGMIVLAPGVFAHDGDEISDEEKAQLDRLHHEKIARSQLVYVVNPGGYIGSSTAREIEVAEWFGIPIEYLEERQEQ